MKIYGVPASPFVQRVLMAARIKGHELPVDNAPGMSLQSPEFRAISPMGRIPVLEEDGWTLPESAAIVGYLDDVLEGPPLLPGAPRERAHARLIDALASNELAGLRPIIVCKVFRMKDDPSWVANAEDQVKAGLAALEQARNPAHAWAAGDQPTLADCLLLPLLTLMEIIDPVAGTAALIADAPGVAAYKKRASATELGANSIDAMEQGFAEIFERRRQKAQAPQQ